MLTSSHANVGLMQVRKTTVGNIAYGVHWSMDQPFELEDKLETSSPEESEFVIYNTKVAIKKDDPESAIVFGVGATTSENKPQGKVYSAAMMLAKTLGSAIVWESLSQDKAWICLVVDGVPMPGGDAVYHIDMAKAQFHDLEGYAPYGIKTYGIRGNEPVDWDAIFESSKETTLAECELKTNLPASKILMLAAIALMSIYGVYQLAVAVYEKLTTEPEVVVVDYSQYGILESQLAKEEDDQFKICLAQEKERREWEAVIQETYQKKYLSGEQISLWTQDSVKRVYALQNKAPKGWILKGANCKRLICLADWQRDYGNRKDVFLLPGDRVSPKNFDQAQSLISLPAIHETNYSYVANEASKIDFILADFQHRYDTGSVKLEFMKSNKDTVIPPESLNQIPPAYLGYTGVFRVQSENIGLLNAVLTKTQAMMPIRMETMVMTFEPAKTTLMVTGNFYQTTSDASIKGLNNERN